MYRITLTEYDDKGGIKTNGMLELVPGGIHPQLFNYIFQTKTWPEMLVIGGVFYAIDDGGVFCAIDELGYEVGEATYLKTTGFIL